MWKKPFVLIGGIFAGILLAASLAYLSAGRDPKNPVPGDYETCMRECIKISNFSTCNAEISCGQRKRK